MDFPFIIAYLVSCFILFHLFITNGHSMHDYLFTDGLTLSPTPVLPDGKVLVTGTFVHLFIATAFTPHSDSAQYITTLQNIHQRHKP